MSHHSEDTFAGSSDSFWEPHNYKRTTKRIDDGNKLCGDLMTLVTERADIEKNYAKALRQWATKWDGVIEKGPEYGTTEAAWRAVLSEANRRCDLHNRVKEDLNTKVNASLKQWQKDNYHKSMMNLREKKEMDDSFKRAQKPWAKLLSKVNKAKVDYHAACKAEKTVINQERNASSDSSLSQDQLRKLKERVNKAKDQVCRTREQYECNLQDLNNYNNKYMEDMTEVFERCQRMEAQRLQTFKETLFLLQKCLNISEDSSLPAIYEEFYHTVNNADHEKDLKWWSNTYGIHMPMAWPSFEEYTEEFRDIASKHKKAAAASAVADGSITLINQRHVGDDLPPPDFLTRKLSNASLALSTSTQKTNSVNGELNSHAKENGSGAASTSSRNGHSVAKVNSNPAPVAVTPRETKANHKSEMSNGDLSPRKEENPFDDEEWDDHDALVDHGEPGVRVRALYDYDAAEEDELGFKAGDFFEKLEDEDAQGWCKGRKDGRVGLYPANYVEVAD